MAIRRAGRLRHRILIERRAVEYDSLGHESLEWKVWKSVAAEVKTPSGRELERARQVVAEVTTLITIRYLAGLTTKDRVKFGSRIIHIGAAVDDDNQKRELVIFGSEVVG
jgi:SPP1 family predicted phage head-tail adaptor